MIIFEFLPQLFFTAFIEVVLCRSRRAMLREVSLSVRGLFLILHPTLRHSHEKVLLRRASRAADCKHLLAVDTLEVVPQLGEWRVNRSERSCKRRGREN